MLIDGLPQGDDDGSRRAGAKLSQRLTTYGNHLLSMRAFVRMLQR